MCALVSSFLSCALLIVDVLVHMSFCRVFFQVCAVFFCPFSRVRFCLVHLVWLMLIEIMQYKYFDCIFIMIQSTRNIKCKCKEFFNKTGIFWMFAREFSSPPPDHYVIFVLHLRKHYIAYSKHCTCTSIGRITYFK